MLDDEDEIDGIVLPMLRLQAHEEQGFIREDTSCRLFYIKRMEYCAARLADEWLDGNVKVVRVKLPDLDQHDLPLNAVCVARAAKVFQETCHILNHNFWVEFKRRPLIAHKNELQEITWGYDIPPIGVCDVLGYGSDTKAWMLTHPSGPVLLTKPDDPDAEKNINKFLLHWAQAEAPDHFWQKHEGPELCVTQAMLTLSTGKGRRRAKAPGVRRFLGL
jgi:hypothetical protein